MTYPEGKIQVTLVGGPMDLDDSVVEWTYKTMRLCVADETGVSTAAVRAWEQGVCAPVAPVQKRVLAAISRLSKKRKPNE